MDCCTHKDCPLKVTLPGSQLDETDSLLQYMSEDVCGYIHYENEALLQSEPQ
ncbi:hypothetical protein KIL84_007745, partial [Mauremys mutica]